MRSFTPKSLPQTSSISLQNSNRSLSKPGSAQTTSVTPKSTISLVNNNENQETGSNSKYSSNPQPTVSTERSSKVPKKSLVIDVNTEDQSYNILNNHRISSYSTTNSVSTSSSQFFRGVGTFTSNGTLSVRNCKLESPSNNSNSTSSKKSGGPTKVGIFSGNFPRTTTNIASNRIGSASATGSLDAFLSQISPKSFHFRSASTKPNAYGLQKTSTKTSDNANSQIASSEQQQQQHIVKESSKENEISYSHPTLKKSSNDRENKENTHSCDPAITKSVMSSQQIIHQKALIPIPNHEPTKCSVKRNGIVKAYAANTNQGIVRNYNEDRVSIILNIMKPASRMNEEWPKCSFFGVYDGHGGVNCADFLRDNLHQYVIREPSFPWDPKEAIMRGFESAEQAFLNLAETQPSGDLDKSGSCAIVALIVGDMCYIANVGDSRAVMSSDGGAKVYNLSRDHKPNDDNEQKRILEGGGKIYQTQAPIFRPASEGIGSKGETQFLLGPHRVFPGRLSVSRTFGDIEAKYPKYGGNPNVVIATPEIKSFKISDNHDFIILACDGIYDKLSSRDVIKSVWESTNEKASDIHHQCGLGVEDVMREALCRRTLDNITVLMISFKNFKHKVFPRSNKGEGASHESHPEMKEVSTSQSSQQSRPVYNGASSKQDAKALRERVNNSHKNSESNFSGSNSSGRTSKTFSFLRENNSNIIEPYTEGKRQEKENLSLAKDSFTILSRKTPKHAHGHFENDENQNNDAYITYLQQGKISKNK